jgi:hypothetical protein
MAVKLSPIFNDAQLDSSGNPLSGGKLYTYEAGSTTSATTYQDSTGSTAHANPIVLDSRGEPSAPIWLTSGSTYKFILKTSADVTIRTVDNVAGVNDTAVSADEWVSGATPTYISAKSFSLAGDQTSTYTVGRRLKSTNTAGTIYSTIISSAFSSVTTITVENDSGSLDSGLSAVSYGLINPTNSSIPGTVAVYSNQLGFRNRVIGGDFQTNPWQRGTTVAVAAAGSGYGADRFAGTSAGAVAFSLIKTADAPTASEAGIYTSSCLHLDVTTQDASLAATDLCSIYTTVEGYNIADLGFGQTGTRYVTLSFWVKSTITGTYGASLANSASDRSYVKIYTVDAADTWERKVLTFPVDVTGTWLYTTGIGLRIRWAVMAGTNFQTTADTWAAGNYLATSAQANGVNSTSNNFKLALVQLEAGAHSTTFEAIDVATVAALCQRYYEKSFAIATAPAASVGTNTGELAWPATVAGATNNFSHRHAFKVLKRAAPTMTLYNPGAAGAEARNISDGADCSSTTSGSATDAGFRVATTGNAGNTVGDLLGIHWVADAEL